MKSVVIGGTAGLGREIATALAKKGHTLLITGKDKQDVDASVANLQHQYEVKVSGLVVDASNQRNFYDVLIAAASDFGSVDSLFLPIGNSNVQDNGDLEVPELNDVISANFTSVVIAVQAFSPGLKLAEKAAIVGFSSISAIRGREKNVIYAGSKRALESYFDSLRMILSDTNISVICYRIGYLDTYQTYGKRLLFPRADPKNVAENIVTNLNRTRVISYFPRYWLIISFLIKLVPMRLFKRASS